MYSATSFCQQMHTIKVLSCETDQFNINWQY